MGVVLIDRCLKDEFSGFLNFQPKDARGIDKTTGKVDINDPTDSSNIDDSSSSSSSDSDNEDERRAKTPTPHGRRKKMKKKKGAQRVRSGSSSASGSSSDTAKEKSDDEEKKKKENGNEKEEDEEEDKKQVMARFFCAKPVGQKNDSEDDEKSDDESKNKKENNDGNEKTKEKIQDYDETRQSVGGVKRVSMSSSSDSESDGEKAKAKGSSDDYSDSRKDENRVKTVTATPKIVDMGDEENAHAQDKLVMESQRPATATEVGAREEGVEVTKSEARRRDSQADDEEDNSKRDVQKVNYSAEQSAFYGKGFQDNDRDDASSTSSSPSSSSSSGSATLHDKGPNTVNDPTLTLDDRWREQSGDETKNNGGEEMEKEEEKEMEKKEQEEEQREKPRVQIIREDLNKKPESDSSSASSSSSSDDSDSDEEKKAGKKTTTWQAQADVHQSESQPESDPEATHGGNDPDNVANGSSDLNGSRTFEPAVPEKAKPGSVLPLLEASHSTLEIKGVTLNKSQVYEVAEFLEREHGINSVNLVNCGIDDDDVQKLMEVIQQSPSNPLMLNLGLNPLTVESVHHILMACKRKPTIEAVLLQGTRLGDDGVNALVTGMMAQMEDKKMRGESTEQCIHELDLSDCKFGDQGALGIARLLTSPLDIDTLTLTHNHAISSDGWKAIGDALKHNRNLETLTLDHNYIGDDGIEHITQGLFDNSCVTAIDINDVGISDKGGKSIMELLKRNTYLLEITVMENKLTDEMADNIQRYISLNKASYSPK